MSRSELEFLSMAWFCLNCWDRCSFWLDTLWAWL